MTGEEPVDPNEYVLRRIHRGNTDLDAPTIVKRCEFEPKPRDVDGLSFFREKYTPVEVLVNAARSPEDAYIVRLTVAQITALGLTLEMTAGDLPGHVSVPEVSYARFLADKITSKELQRRLAVLASEHIVHSPPTIDPSSPSPA